MNDRLPEGGRIAVVGTGPGAVEQMTIRARQAIQESAVVVGYKTYVGLIEGLLAGKEVLQSGMRKSTGPTPPST